jgi:hypothetical protein
MIGIAAPARSKSSFTRDHKDSQMISFRANFSRSVLLQMLVVGAVLVAAALLNADFLHRFYLGKQVTPIGIIINGAIFALFLSGIGIIISNLLRYAGEEKALARFIRNIDDNEADLKYKVAPRSLIARRYDAIMEINRQNAPVNHSALAAMLSAEEGTQVSLPKFINNILILTGVFGTIVSLSVALLGASDLLESANDLEGMGLVIHGMSTALSTTITAIVSYLVFGYFYLKLVDAQTHLIRGIEEVTSIYLVPRYTTQQEGIVSEVGALVRALRLAAEQLTAAQEEYALTAARLREAIDLHGIRMASVSEDVKRANALLREGFRLNHLDE